MRWFYFREWWYWTPTLTWYLLLFSTSLWKLKSLPFFIALDILAATATEWVRKNRTQRAPLSLRYTRQYDFLIFSVDLCSKIDPLECEDANIKRILVYLVRFTWIFGFVAIVGRFLRFDCYMRWSCITQTNISHSRSVSTSPRKERANEQTTERARFFLSSEQLLLRFTSALLSSAVSCLCVFFSSLLVFALYHLFVTLASLLSLLLQLITYLDGKCELVCVTRFFSFFWTLLNFFGCYFFDAVIYLFSKNTEPAIIIVLVNSSGHFTIADEKTFGNPARTTKYALRFFSVHTFSSSSYSSHKCDEMGKTLFFRHFGSWFSFIFQFHLGKLDNFVFTFLNTQQKKNWNLDRAEQQ